jgi:hypothetical protein
LGLLNIHMKFTSAYKLTGLKPDSSASD